MGDSSCTFSPTPAVTYEPLHHKYRPQTFAALVGQEAIATTLTNAIRTERIAPAYLFTGSRGTGKTSSARILAKSLNCLQGNKPTEHPCGACEVCVSITKGHAVDVIEIDAASNTGVDNIRELIEKAQFAPVQCRYKVYVIDECLAGDSLVLTSDGLVRIDCPTIQETKVLSYNEASKTWEFKKVVRWLAQGVRQTLTINTTNREIKCTGNHLIRTDKGWISAKDIQQGTAILSPVKVSAASLLPTLRKKAIDVHRSSFIAHGNEQLTMNNQHMMTSLEIVKSVKANGYAHVYDIEVENNHNFVANGLLVHNCHQLSSAAFNALLKTLEEPPRQVVFVLATTDPQRVLPTIISRCQRFDFRRIPIEAMVQHLRKIAEIEKIKITGEAITLLAQVAQGGLRDAESLLDQLSLLAGEVTVEQVWDLVGAVPERDLMDLLRAIASDSPEAVLEKVRNLMDRGREPLIVLQNLAGFYRDLLIAKTAPSRNDLVAVTSPTWTAMREFTHAWETAMILRGQKHLKDSEAQIKNTTQPRLWLEVTLLGLLPSANVVGTEDGSTAAINFKASQKHRSQPSPNFVTHQQLTAHSAALESKQVNNSISPPQLTPQEETAPIPVQSENSESTSLNSQPVASKSVNMDRLVNLTPTGSEGVTKEPVQAHQHTHAVSESEAPASELGDSVGASATLEGAQTVGTRTVAAQQTELEQVWQQVLAHLQPPATQALLRQHCHLLAFDKTVAVACIGISSQPLLKLAASKLPNIEAAFEQIFKHRVKVNFQVGSVANSKTTFTEAQQTSSETIDSVPALEVKQDSSNNYLAKPSLTQPSSKVQSSTGMNAHKATHSPETPPPLAQPMQPQASQPPERVADAVAIASQSFAKFFDAEIINLGDKPEKNVETLELKSLPESAVNYQSPAEEVITPIAELELDDDDDIPF